MRGSVSYAILESKRTAEQSFYKNVFKVKRRMNVSFDQETDAFEMLRSY